MSSIPGQSGNIPKRVQAVAQSSPVPTGAGVSSQRRSEQSMFNNEKKKVAKILTKVFDEITIIRCPFALDDIPKQKGAAEYMKICDTIADRPTQVVSAMYVDCNNKPILVYLGSSIERLMKGGNEEAATQAVIDLEDQYKDRTADFLEKCRRDHFNFKIHCNGLSPSKHGAYQVAAQNVMSKVSIPGKPDVARHGQLQFMEYQRSLDGGIVGGDDAILNENMGAHQIVGDDEMDVDKEDKSRAEYERAGVAHFCHAWAQKGHHEGLYISKDIMGTTKSMLGVKNFYKDSSAVTTYVSEALRVFFPDYYIRYEKAFAAGRVFDEDIGPFLARAIIYKLQGNIHIDGRDAGPSVSFGVGQYEGAQMIVPQLGAKFLYGPGEMLLFHSSKLWHYVTPWKASTGVQFIAGQATVTPGRVGTVYFFPANSMRQLEGKPEGWFTNTGGGLDLWR